MWLASLACKRRPGKIGENKAAAGAAQWRRLSSAGVKYWPESSWRR